MGNRKSVIAASFLATAGLLLVGCGSSDSAESEATGSATAKATSSASASAETASENVVAVIAGNADTTTLATAVEAAGLVETLEGEGPFTVFAPNNDAFAALPAGVLDKLIQPANLAALQQILTYHVVAANVPSSDVKDGTVTTVEGQDITLDTSDGVKVNDAKVTKADLKASNGVVHVIDTVLLPPGFDPATLQ
jgi:uncharacterized surface protein with fasciclin (FAS1) repeats